MSAAHPGPEFCCNPQGAAQTYCAKLSTYGLSGKQIIGRKLERCFYLTHCHRVPSWQQLRGSTPYQNRIEPLCAALQMHYLELKATSTSDPTRSVTSTFFYAPAPPPSLCMCFPTGLLFPTGKVCGVILRKVAAGKTAAIAPRLHCTADKPMEELQSRCGYSESMGANASAPRSQHPEVLGDRTHRHYSKEFSHCDRVPLSNRVNAAIWANLLEAVCIHSRTGHWDRSSVACLHRKRL